MYGSSVGSNEFNSQLNVFGRFNRKDKDGVDGKNQNNNNNKNSNSASTSNKAKVKVDRNGTPLLMVGNYTQNTTRQRAQSARRVRQASLRNRPTSSSSLKTKKRHPSSATHGNTHIQNALAVVNQIHQKTSAVRNESKNLFAL